jgi:hypothetical protein
MGNKEEKTEVRMEFGSCDMTMIMKDEVPKI